MADLGYLFPANFSSESEETFKTQGGKLQRGSKSPEGRRVWRDCSLVKLRLSEESKEFFRKKRLTEAPLMGEIGGVQTYTTEPDTLAIHFLF